jgi:integrase
VDTHPDGAIFRNGRGHCVNPQSVAESFRRALRRAGIKRCRFHDLRHTFATRLAQRRWDLATVGALLGHTPPYRETMRYFAHTSEDRMRAALGSLSRQKSVGGD